LEQLKGKRTRGRTGSRWEKEIKTDFKEIGSLDMERSNLLHDMNKW
jgi:hypothetical protein